MMLMLMMFMMGSSDGASRDLETRQQGLMAREPRQGFPVSLFASVTFLTGVDCDSSGER